MNTVKTVVFPLIAVSFAAASGIHLLFGWKMDLIGIVGSLGIGIFIFVILFTIWTIVKEYLWHKHHPGRPKFKEN